MFKIESLNKTNQDHFLDLNTMAIQVKEDTYDIYGWYTKLPWYKKFVMRRQIKVFKYNNSYIGYGFFTKDSYNNYAIKSFYVKDETKSNELFKMFFQTIGTDKAIITATTIKPKMSPILENNNFKIQSKSIEMWLDINDSIVLNLNLSNISIVDFCEDKDECYRCDVQNSVFQSENRIPLSIDDILFEETQNYYIKGGSIFLLYENQYIGYGQIILENNVPVIVNVGILDNYRGRGYGKLLIYELINKAISLGFHRIKIRCYLDNTIALNLYRSIGFVESNELNSWIYKKDGNFI